MSCACEKPREPVDPRHKGSCMCGKRIDPAALSTDENVRAFFDRLTEGIFPYDKLAKTWKPDRAFEEFRCLCEARERAGRDTFGLAYLARKNLWDAAEEEADAVVYRHLRLLQRFHEEGDQEGMDLILEASRKSFEAFRLDREAEARLKGAP